MSKVNPYSLFSVGGFLVIVLYAFHFSGIYPALSIALLFFLLFVFSIALFMGLSSRSTDSIESLKFSFSINNHVVLFIVFVMTYLDGRYSGGFPLLGSVQYDAYGMPTVHPILMVIISYFILNLFCIFLTNKKYKKIALLYIVFSMLLLSLALSRGTIVMTVLNCLWAYLYIRGSKIQINFGIFKKFFLFLLVLLILMFFGISGNYRLNSQVGLEKNDPLDSSLILQIGDGPSEFNNKSFGMFFWSYLYATCSLANLQNMININLNNKVQDKGVSEFVVSQLLPDMVGKKVNPSISDNLNQYTSQYRIVPELNTGTTFFGSFYILHWFGMWLMAFFILLFPIIYLSLLEHFAKRYLVFGLVILNTMYSLLMFDNMFTFSGLSIQLLLPILQGALYRRHNNERRQE